MFAAINGQIEAVKTLVSLKADVNAKDDRGERSQVTVLDIATLAAAVMVIIVATVSTIMVAVANVAVIAVMVTIFSDREAAADVIAEIVKLAKPALS